MTNQEIFDKVTTHLLTQKAKAMVGHQCRYRTPDGLSCAVGCLIKDEHYSPALEGSPLSYNQLAALIASGVLEETATFVDEQVSLLCKLQHIHDAEAVEMWFDCLRDVAMQYGLAFNPPVV